MPLQLGGADKAATSKVLHVTDVEQHFTFVNVPEEPVPTLLRDFSAPVKLHFDYSRDELMFIISHDSDGFVRWEAAQQLGLQVIHEGLQEKRTGRTFGVDPLLVTAYRAVLEASLQDATIDKARVAN